MKYNLCKLIIKRRGNIHTGFIGMTSMFMAERCQGDRKRGSPWRRGGNSLRKA
jgi:hypothetical protein